MRLKYYVLLIELLIIKFWFSNTICNVRNVKCNVQTGVLAGVALSASVRSTPNNLLPPLPQLRTTVSAGLKPESPISYSGFDAQECLQRVILSLKSTGSVGIQAWAPAQLPRSYLQTRWPISIVGGRVKAFKKRLGPIHLHGQIEPCCSQWSSHIQHHQIYVL
jgi:hypothetical protein